MQKVYDKVLKIIVVFSRSVPWGGPEAWTDLVQPFQMTKYTFSAIISTTLAAWPCPFQLNKSGPPKKEVEVRYEFMSLPGMCERDMDIL